MKAKFAVTYSVAMLLLSFCEASISQTVAQPKNWGVQYQDASCIVHTDAAGASGDSPYQIKMGYLHGNQLVLLFSISNEAYQRVKFPQGTKAFFMVDNHPFKAMGIDKIKNEIVLPVENSIELQRALTHARALAIRVTIPTRKAPIDIVSLQLENISGAVRWLQSCSTIGAGALPK